MTALLKPIGKTRNFADNMTMPRYRKRPLALALVIGLFLTSLAGCGTLQMGIEETPTPVSVGTIETAPPGTARVTPPGGASTGVPAPTAGPSPTEAPERITFPVNGTTFTFTTRLVPGVPQRYVLQIQAQQKMTITTSSHVTIQVLDGQNRPLKPTTSAPGVWQGTIPATGDYVIVLNGQGLVTVMINIPPPG